MRGRRVRHVAAASLALIILLAITHSIWLGWLGDVLVSAVPPVKADAALVLAGDFVGNRIKTAAELVRAGYVPKVLVSGPVEYYGLNEADVAIRFAVKNGYPEEWFEPVKFQSYSTREEADSWARELRKRGIRSLLLVTSDYHTARSARLFRKAVPEIEIFPIAAPDPNFTAHGWWHTREGWKTWFYETTKTVTGLVGI